MPDEPFMLFVNSQGHVTSRDEGIQVSEAGHLERTVTLSRTPKPAKVGDLAPPILVTTVDGQARSLADYQGRYVLLVLWSMQFGAVDLPHIKTIQEKYGKSEKFAILGLNYDVEPKVFNEAIKTEKLLWPNARLGSAYDMMIAAFGWERTPSAILIGPDGTILNKDLNGDEIEKAVSDNLK